MESAAAALQPPPSFLTALERTLSLCSLPSGFMLLGSLAVQFKQPSSTVVQMTQHLGAGIVLSAVATELLPAMSAQAKTSWARSSVATLVGFFLGVAMMVSVEHFSGEAEDEEGEEEGEGGGEADGNDHEHNVTQRRMLNDQLESDESSSSAEGGRGDAQDTSEMAPLTAAQARLEPIPLRPAISTPNSVVGRAAKQQLLHSSSLSKSLTGARRRSLLESYRRSSVGGGVNSNTSSPVLRGSVTIATPSSGDLLTSAKTLAIIDDERALSRSSDSGGPLSRTFSAAASIPSLPRESTALLPKNPITVKPPYIPSSGSAGGDNRRTYASINDSSPSCAVVDIDPRNHHHHHHDQHTHTHHHRLQQHLSDHHHEDWGEGGGVVRGQEKAMVSKSMPWTLVIAVFVDSFMDGLLIGISAVAGKQAGAVMCIALTFEMTFLGMTFSAGVGHLPSHLIKYALIIGAPAMLLVGGGVGAVAAAALSQNPILQIGLIAFGVAALLYLVTEELLIEAHENGEGHKWFVDMCFFVGFILSVLLEQAMQA